MKPGTPLHVTLVALQAHALVSRSAASGITGGIETRSWTLARQLRRLGLTVTYIVNQVELEPRQVVEDVEVLAKPLPARKSAALRAWIALTAGTTILQRMFPLLARIRRALLPPPPSPKPWQPASDPFVAAAPGGVLVCFGVSRHSASAVKSAHESHRRAVLMLASDGDLSADYVLGSIRLNAYGDQAHACAWALQHADAVVAQTQRQRELLKARFGRDAAVLPNPMDLEQWQSGEPGDLPFDAPPGYMLWVGRADNFHKRAPLMLELARRCPRVRFVMIMNPRQDEVEKQVRASLPANITLVRWVAFERMPAVFHHACALVSTSAAEFEGLPNTFLQAGASGKPVLSLEADPDLLAVSGGGLVASGSLDQLARDVMRLHEHPALCAELGRRLRTHVEQHHSLSAVGQQFASLLSGVAAASEQTAATAR